MFMTLLVLDERGGKMIKSAAAAQPDRPRHENQPRRESPKVTRNRVEETERESVPVPGGKAEAYPLLVHS